MNIIEKQRLLENVSVFQDTYSILSEEIECKYFYTLNSEFLPNGDLRMNTAGMFKSGELLGSTRPSPTKSAERTACRHGKKDWDSDMNESTDHQPMKEEIDR